MCVVELWLRGSESGLCTIRAKSGRFDNERKIRSRKTGEDSTGQPGQVSKMFRGRMEKCRCSKQRGLGTSVPGM
jgi:hypothetical protein